MGGDATFSGTTYQARVLACIAVHVLTQRPLRWLGWLDDTPQAVAGETSGPGDDARVELRPRAPAFEVQAKHGLTAGRELDKVIAGLASVPAGERALHVVLVVDRGSTTGLYTEFATDLDWS